MLGRSIHTVKNNTEALAVASKETELEVNAVNTVYIVMSRDQNAGQIQNIKTDNSSFKRVEQFKYLVTTLKNQNFTQEEIKSRLKSGNACYHVVQNIILPLVLYGYETWSLTLREECGLRVFEKRVLKRIFGLKKDKMTTVQNKLHNEVLNDLHSSPTTIWVIKMRKMGGACSMYEGEVHTGCWWGNRRGREHL
jgi:hypothetical protein